MKDYACRSGYRDDPALRRSFNDLSRLVFGLDFEDWYQRGFWREPFDPHTLFDGDRAVANVSVSFMELMVRGKSVRAIQLGTVMTHPDYRRQGLAALLMNRVLEKYEKDCAFIYLFANPSVLGFYPKFGFERAAQREASVLLPPATAASKLRKLHIDDPADYGLLLRLCENRRPASPVLDAVKNPGLLMFYCGSFLKDCLYYLPGSDLILVLRKEGGDLLLMDVISRGPFALSGIMGALPGGVRLRLGFTPAPEEGFETGPADEEDILFMRPVPKGLAGAGFRFPLLSHT